MSDFDRLKSLHRVLRDGFGDGLNLRVHRALSWIKAAEVQARGSDEQLILYWISLNAAYAEYRADEVGIKDRQALTEFLQKVVSLDQEGAIYSSIWTTFAGSIRSLLANPYIFDQYWNHVNGVDGYEEWESVFQRRSEQVKRALSGQDTGYILDELFRRLYVLRNQLVHGGATWQSAVNRDQVRDGGAVLAALVPVFVELMMRHPDATWGDAHYPVQE